MADEPKFPLPPTPKFLNQKLIIGIAITIVVVVIAAALLYYFQSPLVPTTTPPA